MNRESRYVIQDEMIYHTKQGDSRPAEFLLMTAPKGKHTVFVARLRQSVMKAGFEAEEHRSRVAAELLRQISEAPADPPIEMPSEVEEEPEEGEADDGLWIVSLVARSTVDLGDFYLAGRSLFKQKGVVLVDGEVNMTDTLMDEMSARDFDGLIGAYVAGFMLPSS